MNTTLLVVGMSEKTAGGNVIQAKTSTRGPVKGAEP